MQTIETIRDLNLHRGDIVEFHLFFDGGITFTATITDIQERIGTTPLITYIKPSTLWQGDKTIPYADASYITRIIKRGTAKYPPRNDYSHTKTQYLNIKKGLNGTISGFFHSLLIYAAFYSKKKVEGCFVADAFEIYLKDPSGLVSVNYMEITVSRKRFLKWFDANVHKLTSKNEEYEQDSDEDCDWEDEEVFENNSEAEFNNDPYFEE